MTAITDRYPDLLDEDHDPDLMHIVTGLDTMRRAITAETLPAVHNQATKEALTARARTQTSQIPIQPLPAIHTSRSRFRRLRMYLNQSRKIPTTSPALSPLPLRERGRGEGFREGGRQRRTSTYLASFASAALLVLAGMVGYLRLQAPTPVSAARILHRAAAAVTLPAAGDVVHEIMTDTDHFITSPNQGVAPGSTYVNKLEQWSRYSSDGNVDRFSLSWVVNGALVERIVLNDQGYWFYDPKSTGVTKDPPTEIRLDTTPNEVIWPKTIMTQPPNPKALRTLLLNAANAPNTELLPQQTVDGRLMDVVRVTHQEPIPRSSIATSPVPLTTKEIFRLYIDDSTYAVRQIDQQDVDSEGTVLDTSSLHVTTDETLAASEVPSDVFAFNPATGAQPRSCLATETCSPAPSSSRK
jgi:hypothetical protein